MGMDEFHKGGKRQSRCIEPRPLWLWQSSSKGKEVTSITHLDQQLAAFGARECSIQTVQPTRPRHDEHRLAAGEVVPVSTFADTLYGQGPGCFAASAIMVAAGALDREQAVHVPNPSTHAFPRKSLRLRPVVATIGTLRL